MASPGYGTVPAYDPSKTIAQTQAARRGGTDFHGKSIATLVAAPWSVFVFVNIITAVLLARLAWFVYLVFIAALAAGVVLAFVNNKAKGPMYLYLSVLIIAGSTLGFAIGKNISDTYMVQYWAPVLRPHYENIAPVSPALAVADGGQITFAGGTNLDHNHALGLSVPLSGSRYCVAPIVGSDAGAEVNFWAGGKDCCNHRGEFVCGDASEAGVTSGMVFTDSTSETAWELAAFRKAVKQASAVYGLETAEKPVVVLWAKDIDDARWPYCFDSILLLLAWAALYFGISLGAGALLHWSNASGRGGLMSMMVGQP